MNITRRNFIYTTAGLTLAVSTRSFANPADGQILFDFDKGMSNFQCHAFDVVNRHLYTLQHSDQGGGGPARITRFDMDSGVKPRMVDSLAESYTLGHQTLDIEYLGSGLVKIWAAIGPKFSRGVVRFDYNPSGPPLNVEAYQLFDPSKFAASHCTASISIDQRFLVARGLSAKESEFSGRNCIAIFDLLELVTLGPGDRWNLAKFLWPIDNYPSKQKFDPQAVVCDGASVWVLYGPLPIEEPNLMRIYNFQCQLVRELSDMAVGRDNSRLLSEGKANEFEGAKLVKLRRGEPAVLTVGMIQGGPIYYKRIWELNDHFTQTQRR